MSSIPDISVQDLKALRDQNADFLLLDVRNPDEYAFCNIGGLLMPANELPTRLHELNREQQIIVHCRSGGRSSRITEFLLKQGFQSVFNLRGGIIAWATEIDPSIPTY